MKLELIKSHHKTLDDVELYVEHQRPFDTSLTQQTTIDQNTARLSSSAQHCIWSHGFTGSARNWRGCLKSLSEHTHTIYDIRGHSRSDGPHERNLYTYQRLAQDIVELASCNPFIDQDLMQPVAAGLSLGAMLSLKACQTVPHQFSGLILSSMPMIESEHSIAHYAVDFAHKILEEGLEVAGEAFVWGDNSGMSLQEANLVKQGFLVHPDYALAYLLLETLSQLPTASEVANSLQNITQQGIPVCLLVGTQDKAAVAQLAAMRKAWKTDSIQGLTIVEVNKGGHLLNLTSPEIFYSTIKNWLAEIA